MLCLYFVCLYCLLCIYLTKFLIKEFDYYYYYHIDITFYSKLIYQYISFPNKFYKPGYKISKGFLDQVQVFNSYILFSTYT